MVAYHFPPLAGSSGIQRTLRFVQYLREFGWEPAVLTASIRAYERTSPDLTSEVPSGVVVERAYALDAARHTSVAGRYPGFLARPDRWMTWKYDAVRIGMRRVRQWRPDAIWSTFPIATAHLIGAALHRRSALPWIADFRDPMAQDGYPEDPRVWQSFKRTEEVAIRHARFSVFTTPGAAQLYRNRYPELAARVQIIENGFDEESFDGTGDAPREPLNPGALTLLHSGIVYPSERDPTHLFEALRKIIDRGAFARERLKIRFRAALHDRMLDELGRRHGIRDMIQIEPQVPYRAALEEMLRADGLLVLQSANCNEQIPAKLYEYLRAGRPIVALTDPRGDTAGVIRQAGLDAISPLDSVDGIAASIEHFVTADPGMRRLPRAEYVAGASRRHRAGELAALLEQAVSPR